MIPARGSLVLGAMSVVVSSSPAYAYLDPGTGSIVLQAIIGGIAASLFVLRGYYQALKRFVGIGARVDRSEKTSDE